MTWCDAALIARAAASTHGQPESPMRHGGGSPPVSAVRRGRIAAEGAEHVHRRRAMCGDAVDARDLGAQGGAAGVEGLEVAARAFTPQPGGRARKAPA